MKDENKNTVIIALGLILVSIYIMLGLLSIFGECYLHAKEPIAENSILYFDPDDDTDNDEEEEIEEEEPLIRCPTNRPITPYELFEYNNDILKRPTFWMMNCKKLCEYYG